MFAVVTDSTVYFTRQEATQLQVRVLPMLYTVGSMSCSEGYLDENGRYLDLLANGTEQHTAQVSVSTFMSAFNELRRKGMDILCVTISSRLSGTYSSAVMAAKECGPDHILVVDSLSTVGGMRFLVEHAVALSAQNKSISEAADELEALREHVGIVLSVDDMTALRRSGRLGFVRQSVSTVLNLRPIFYCKDGTVVAGAVARGSANQYQEIVQSVPEGAKRILVHYVSQRGAAETLARKLRRIHACEISIQSVGPVLAIHLGLGAIGASWQC